MLSQISIDHQDMSPEEHCFDYSLEHYEKSLRDIARAREEIRKGRFVSLDDLPD